MRSELAGTILTILIASSLGVGYLIGGGVQQTITRTSTSVSTSTLTTTSTLTSVSTSTLTLQQTSVITTTMSLTTTALGGFVEVVSVIGPILPVNPGGPVVSITLRNVVDAPITSLSATLLFNAVTKLPYSFVFSVNSSNPLMPGQTIQETRTLINGGFDSSLQYPLTINGALINGTQFSYTEQIRVVPPG